MDRSTAEQQWKHDKRINQRVTARAAIYYVAYTRIDLPVLNQISELLLCLSRLTPSITRIASTQTIAMRHLNLLALESNIQRETTHCTS